MSTFRRLTEFGADASGGIALKFAMAVPAIALLTLGGIDLQAVHAASARLQGIADTAALAGGRELSLAVDPSGPVHRAGAFVEGQLSEWAGAPAVIPEIDVIEVDGQRALKVALAGNRPSFFGNLLPPGGWAIRAEAVASPVALAPLCVLTTGQTSANALWLRQQAAVDAPQCLLHSNRKIMASDRSHILAAITQASNTAQGNIQAAPQTGAPIIPDPYIDLKPTLPGRCSLIRTVKEYKTSGTLSPGLHCNDIVVSGTATLTLAPGEHYFSGNRLLLRGDARLNGQNVVMMFD